MGSGKNRWRISFHRHPSGMILLKKKPSVPREFVCPVSGSLMADPVIVSSGHTFERHCVHACKSLSFMPKLPDGSVPDFTTVIPNVALKSAILNWCRSSLLETPKPIDFLSAERIVRTLMSSENRKSDQNKLQKEPELVTRISKLGDRKGDGNGYCTLNKFTESPSELNQVPSHISTSSVESVTAASAPTTPLTTRPLSYSSPSSSESDTVSPSSLEEDEFISKIKSSQVFEQEEAVVSLRKLTRTREELRVHLCTPRLLGALRLLITSKYASLQVNSVAALVNLSLENRNKVKIVRSGVVPPLIDVLRGGFPESQEHAAGALFSLALDDQNKTAIGVLGALPPLLHALRSDSERTRHDSVLALYHLSLVQSNRAKLVKLGSVQVLLGMVKSGHMTGRILLVLCNLAASSEGCAAMLDAGAVDCLVAMLRRGEFDSESTRDICVAALCGLSHGGLRFKGLAKDAGTEEVLMEVEEGGSQRSREKARKILEVLREKDEEEEGVDWEELLNSEDDTSRTNC